MSPQHEVTTAQRLEVLRLLAIDAYSLQGAADETGIPYPVVCDLARTHGYPENDKLLWAIDHLQTRVDHPDAHIPTPPLPTPPEPEVVRISRPGAPAQPDAGSRLLRQAADSHKARTRNLGAKIEALLGTLAEALASESAEAQARAALAAEEVARKKRIAALKAELAALRGKGVRTVSTGPADATNAKVIRSWAAANGVPCPAMGRIPAAVREQYAARQGVAA